jgi:hypothetical protein
MSRYETEGVLNTAIGRRATAYPRDPLYGNTDSKDRLALLFASQPACLTR